MSIKERLTETIIGIFTLVVFAIFFGFILIKGSISIKADKTYSVFAKFNDIDGINIGSIVKISGLTVGEVEDIFLDEFFMAVVKLKINQKYQIPADSSLSVATSGLIGTKYLMISPGGDEEVLKQSGYFAKTQSSINLDGLIKNFASK